MPELPEVEHAARSLRSWLEGHRIITAEGTRTRVFRGSTPEAFARALRDRAFERIDRRGKTLLFTFDAGAGLLSHLGMSGRWLRRPPGAPPPRHGRARLHLDDGTILHYDDPRMFGRLLVAPAATLPTLKELQHLGPDPLRDGLSPAALHPSFARTSRPVKVALMDPAVIAGIGNIQATEALFRAGVHPACPASALTAAETRAVIAGLDASISHTLASLAAQPEVHYLSQAGGTDNPFLIYDRTGHPCPRCGAVIEKLTLAGRTSAYCPRCQPEPPSAWARGPRSTRPGR
ncbi:MAG TPA: bifunctional DNA-formamidopyrimidine glycosylase/DNA-(apurinic or apyrimidinic site) lyase [Candidatus Nanopelagicales bacterium]|nr:bifunctional DNA-formamidopyrimidine glycosylase/DNA-(apurinic or apyrimidinic site) lyase [Candidatus Nanopelagicales bacterium]